MAEIRMMPISTQSKRFFKFIAFEANERKQRHDLYGKVENNLKLLHISIMRIRLAKILLVLMTLSGIIMPIHAYAHELADTQESHSIEMDDQHDSGGDSISCDHCCHFSSHSLGFMQENSNIANQQVKGGSFFQRQNYTSYNQPPPYHPPIA